MAHHSTATVIARMDAEMVHLQGEQRKLREENRKLQAEIEISRHASCDVLSKKDDLENEQKKQANALASPHVNGIDSINAHLESLLMLQSCASMDNESMKSELENLSDIDLDNEFSPHIVEELAQRICDDLQISIEKKEAAREFHTKALENKRQVLREVQDQLDESLSEKKKQETHIDSLRNEISLLKSSTMERVTEVQKLDDRIARLESDFQRKSTDFENFILNARNQKEKDELKLEGIRKSIQDASLRYESTTSEVKKLKLSISTTNAGLEDLSVHLQTSRLDFDTENNELEDQKKSMQEANEISALKHAKALAQCDELAATNSSQKDRIEQQKNKLQVINSELHALQLVKTEYEDRVKNDMHELGSQKDSFDKLERDSKSLIDEKKSLSIKLQEEIRNFQDIISTTSEIFTMTEQNKYKEQELTKTKNNLDSRTIKMHTHASHIYKLGLVNSFLAEAQTDKKKELEELQFTQKHDEAAFLEFKEQEFKKLYDTEENLRRECESAQAECVEESRILSQARALYDKEYKDAKQLMVKELQGERIKAAIERKENAALALSAMRL